MRTIASRMSVMSGEGALSVFARAQELEAEGRSIIHLELGEPDFHPGQSVIDSATRALAEAKARSGNVFGLPHCARRLPSILRGHVAFKSRPRISSSLPGARSRSSN